MSQPQDETRLELHMLCPYASDKSVELQYITAHFHRTGARLGLNHTVNFGLPWLEGSSRDHALISLR
jgi:hypothetical protein